MRAARLTSALASGSTKGMPSLAAFSRISAIICVMPSSDSHQSLPRMSIRRAVMRHPHDLLAVMRNGHDDRIFSSSVPGFSLMPHPIATVATTGLAILFCRSEGVGQGRLPGRVLNNRDVPTPMLTP